MAIGRCERPDVYAKATGNRRLDLDLGENFALDFGTSSVRILRAAFSRKEKPSASIRLHIDFQSSSLGVMPTKVAPC
jgi:hypothetical protein